MLRAQNFIGSPAVDVDKLMLPNFVWFKDDFITGSGTTSLTAATSVQSGDLGGWAAAQISGGTQTLRGAPGNWANPGQLIFTTSNVSGQGMAFYRGGGSASIASIGELGANAGWEFHAVFALAAITDVCIRIGFTVATAQVNDPPNGIYMEYNTANVGNTDTKFSWVTRDGGSPTYSVVGSPDADTSFHHLKIWSVTAGTILFNIDGGTIGSIAATVPTASLLPVMQVVSRTASTKTAYLDFMSYMATPSRA